jgi:hypothetical protein
VTFVSLTRLRLRGWRYLLPFAWRSFASARQARGATGVLRVQLAAAPWRRVFWTATTWRDEASMRAYRNAGAHAHAMPKLLDWCDEGSMAHWTQDSDALPSPAECLRRMRDEGRTSKVRHPSAAHAAGTTVPDGREPLFAPELPLRR